MTIAKISDFISEGFSTKNGTISYSSLSSDSDGINDKLGISSKNNKFQFRKTSLADKSGIVYSVYTDTTKELEGDITRTDILKALKNQSEYKLTSSEIEEFVRRAAIMCYKNLKNEKIDILLSLDSSSDLVDVFMSELSSRLVGAKVIKRGVIKNDNFDEIHLDKNTPGEDKVLNSINKTIDKMKTDKYFSIKKINPVQYRKYIRGWMKLNTNKITGKNICVVDDFLTSGSSMMAAFHLLRTNGANNVFGLTLFKGGSH